MIEVEEDIIRSDRVPETRKAWTQTCLEGVFDKLRILDDRKNDGKGKAEIDRLEKEANKEAELIGYAALDLHVVVGFKQRTEEISTRHTRVGGVTGEVRTSAISIG